MYKLYAYPSATRGLCNITHSFKLGIRVSFPLFIWSQLSKSHSKISHPFPFFKKEKENTQPQKQSRNECHITLDRYHNNIVQHVPCTLTNLTTSDLAAPLPHVTNKECKSSQLCAHKHTKIYHQHNHPRYKVQIIDMMPIDLLLDTCANPSSLDMPC